MKKKTIFIILVILVITIISIINAPSKNEEDKYELIKTNIINYEKVSFDKEKIEKDTTPEEVEKYLIMRNNKYGWTIVESNLKKESINSLDAIAFAVPSYVTKTYKYASGGVGTVRISSESITIYYYNPKTKTIFAKDKIQGKELPKSTSSSSDYKISGYNIGIIVKDRLGIKRSHIPPLIQVLGVFLLVFVGVPTLLIVISDLKHNYRRKV